MKNFLKNHKVHLAIFLALVAIAIVSNNYSTNKENSPPQIIKEVSTLSATIQIENEDSLTTKIKEESTVLDLMKKLKEKERLTFESKNFGSGLGEYIESINGKKSTDKEFWIYYINNKKATVGVSTYKLQPNDIITWKYEQDETN